ncbi:HdeD family acid-resistance protein [Flammeovirga sp. EKP202]|uniref:HdeD family acid-resistance protein n=1 Tax=Flammeovirga sp. EKP202 TaxID=2770592 RepID=UPI00165F5E68|nr:HdeD family acid-resistance protein [Flammeovirga sp. EKP202]MBD0405466.1 HdeD family acid-resistance protein [Flammeovirga sp. EKP202]
MFKNLKSSVNHWYLLLIAGIMFIVGGILTFTFPIVSYITLATVFAYLFLIEGVSEIIFAIANRKEIKGWGWTLFYGLISFGIGIYLILNPEISFVTMPIYLGFAIMAKSIIGVTMGSEIQKEFGLGGHLIAVGVVGIILSTILIVNPLFAGFTILLTTGIVLISSGVYSILLGLRFRKLNQLMKQKKQSNSDKAEEKNTEETVKEEVSYDEETIIEKSKDEVEAIDTEEVTAGKDAEKKDDVIHL